MNEKRTDHSAAILAAFAALSFLLVALLTYPGVDVRVAAAEPSVGVSYRR